MAVKSRCIRILYHPLVLIFFNFKPSKASKYSLVPKLFFRYVNFNWSWLTNRVLLRILMFWEKIWLCKNASPNHILIIFTLKKDFFTFNNCHKKARILLSLLSKVVSAHDTLTHWHERKPLQKVSLEKEFLLFYGNC